jgi:hypothetical protein
VGHHDHGHPLLGGEGLHYIQNLLDQLRIEGRGNLVEQHDPGPHGQRPGDGHSLLLTTRQPGRVLPRLVLQPHVPEHFPGAVPRFLAGQSEDLLEGHGDVPQRGHVRKQIEGLEHHADVRPGLVEVGAEIGELLVLEPHLPFGGFLEHVDGP